MISRRGGIKMPFYNTTKLQGEQLAFETKRASKGNLSVRKCFEDAPDKEMSPCQVFDVLGGEQLLTSIRRAMTDLTDAGILIKTDHKIKGKYGSRVHTWRLNRNKEAWV